ncbi:MAG: ABC transporter substrate-binding protein [Lachnospiraceae bacterium]|nr:ABC transporter substrate-binding protein [Lachnospiraceae bacterium]
MRKTGKILAALGLMAALVFGFMACGKKENGKDTTSAGTTAERTTGAESSGAESSGADGETVSGKTEKKIMNLGSMGYFAAETMDPANGWDGWYMMYDGATETLFKLDENITPAPNLALTCESDDFITWTITLRDDVTFQNGEKMTGEAVKKCFERTYEVSDRAREQLAIDSIEADGQTLVFHLQQENVSLFSDLCDPLWSVYDSENSDYTSAVYCTGPYRITEFEPYVETVVEKYEGYWGGEPKLDEVHLITISDAEAITMALQNGEIDLAVAMATSTASVFENNPDFVVDAVTTTRANRMYYNMERPALKDVVVRQAIEMCMDRDGIAASLYNGMATPSWGIYADLLPYGGTEGLDLSVDKYDPEGAAALLAGAGWKDTDGDGILEKDGVKLELKAVTFASRKELGQVLELLQSELSAVGIKLNVEILENTNDVVATGDYDLNCETGVQAPTGNAQYFINMMLVTGATSNHSHYSNPRLDALAAELEKTADTDRRTEIIRQIVQMVLDDHAMTIFNHQKMINIYSSNVKGYSTHPSEYYLLDVNTDIERQ